MTIQTPPHSPEEIPRKLSAGRVSPPPPPRSPESDDSDSTAAADSDLDQADTNTRRNSGSLPPPGVPGASGTGAPNNPFAGTLASSEASFGLQRTNERQTEADAQDGEGQPRANTGRPVMDVDQFKNILMTGSAAPSPPVSTPLPRVQDSSSSTDTSSVSRQSLFDPMLEIHPESPRTSFDQMESASGDDDDEDSNLMTGTARLDDLAPPAPPKHTHGKSLGPKGPQTVSWADFDGSIPSSSVERQSNTQPASADRSVKTKPPMLERSRSDLNKPLPKTPPLSPAVFHHAAGGKPETDAIAPRQTNPNVIRTEASPDQKKAPPPPPATRRAGHTGTSQVRARSTSNPTQEYTYEDETPSQSQPTETTPKAAAPPPPPSRKTRPISQTATPTMETPPDASSPSPANEDPKAMPPPPPRRNPSKTGSAVHRTSSNASRPNASRNEAAPTSSNSAPPAPPPRRGTKPNRESMEGPTNSMSWALNSRRLSGDDHRRGSTNSFDSERSTSLSNLQHVAETGETSDDVTSTTEHPSSRDILADMSAFQAEIDALRAQGAKGD